MRAIDRTECTALGRSPKEALRTGLRCSSEAYTGLGDGQPLCMFGVVPEAILGGQARVWFLGADGIERHGRALLRHGDDILAGFLESFERLDNIVSAENEWAIRLLKRWGFTVGDQVIRRGAVDFLPFHMERPAIQARKQAA